MVAVTTHSINLLIYRLLYIIIIYIFEIFNTDVLKSFREREISILAYVYVVRIPLFMFIIGFFFHNFFFQTFYLHYFGVFANMCAASVYKFATIFLLFTNTAHIIMINTKLQCNLIAHYYICMILREDHFAPSQDPSTLYL